MTRQRRWCPKTTRTRASGGYTSCMHRRPPFVRPARPLLLSALLLSLLVATVASLAGGPALFAQRGVQNRVVSGKVIDKGDAPLKGAVVYLKDDHTLSVKSFIAGDTGEYRFGQLAQSTDYELWAELNGKKSGTKSISSFDNKNAFTIDLKIDTSK